jgi:hypothetical protein
MHLLSEIRRSFVFKKEYWFMCCKKLKGALIHGAAVTDSIASWIQKGFC